MAASAAAGDTATNPDVVRTTIRPRFASLASGMQNLIEDKRGYWTNEYPRWLKTAEEKLGKLVVYLEGLVEVPLERNCPGSAQTDER